MTGESSSSICARVRRHLLLRDPGPRPVTADTAEVEAHLQICAACRTYATEARAWRRLGARVREQQTGAPVEVRQRLFRQLAQTRVQWLGEGALEQRRRTRRRTGLVVTAALAVVAVGGIWLLAARSVPPTPDSGSVLAQDQWRELHRASVQSSDPSQIQRWLQQRLTIPIRVVRIPGATLEGARLCFLGGREGAVIRYRVAGAPVSYYIMPAISGHEAAARDRSAIKQEAAQGYNVVLWYEGGLVHALVSSLPRARLLRLAATCRHHDGTAEISATRAG